MLSFRVLMGVENRKYNNIIFYHLINDDVGKLVNVCFP